MAVAKEISIENYLTDQVKQCGGITIKLPANLYVGIPDRLLILPGYLPFVEIKRPKGRPPRANQLWWQRTLRSMGHISEVAYTKDDVDKLLRDFG